MQVLPERSWAKRLSLFRIHCATCAGLCMAMLSGIQGRFFRLELRACSQLRGVSETKVGIVQNRAYPHRAYRPPLSAIPGRSGSWLDPARGIHPLARQVCHSDDILDRWSRNRTARYPAVLPKSLTVPIMKVVHHMHQSILRYFCESIFQRGLDPGKRVTKHVNLLTIFKMNANHN